MKTVKHPCINCVYFAACGSSGRTVPCEGRKTKRERNREERKMNDTNG